MAHTNSGAPHFVWKLWRVSGWHATGNARYQSAKAINRRNKRVHQEAVAAKLELARQTMAVRSVKTAVVEAAQGAKKQDAAPAVVATKVKEAATFAQNVISVSFQRLLNINHDARACAVTYRTPGTY